MTDHDDRGSADPQAAQRAFEDLMGHLGLDAGHDPQLEGTAQRVTALWADLFSGLRAPEPAMSVFEAEDGGGGGEPVVIRDIPFYSMCAHHLLPFFGTFNVAYVPDLKVGGVGSFARVIRHYAMRPQVQERLVEQVADHLSRALSPKGLYVMSQARHLCMEMRGEKIKGGLVCAASTGVLKEGPMRAEVLGLLRGSGR